MSCPFNKDSLDQLKMFIDFCIKKPDIVHLPQLAFFKNYLQSLDAKIPEAAPMYSETPESDAQQKSDSEPAQQEVSEEQPESEPESDLELDMEGCIEPDEISSDQKMGDESKVPSEEEIEKADEKRITAMSHFSEGEYGKAVELLTDAIELNPISAVLYVKRGQSYLKLNKPNACIRDCKRALELNPDSAAGYKFRGRAYRLLADWENAAKDLRQACKIDFDEQTDEWLKEVTPNALKIEQHRLKQERKKAEKEIRARAERIRKAREAHAKAATEGQGGAEEAGGPNFGEAGGMSDFYKLLQDPELMAAFKDPEVAAAFQDISMNPANFVKYQSNPKIMALITKLSSKFQGAGIPGGMGGFPGFPGAGGFGPGMAGGHAKPATDDGLD